MGKDLPPLKLLHASSSMYFCSSYVFCRMRLLAEHARSAFIARNSPSLAGRRADEDRSRSEYYSLSGITTVHTFVKQNNNNWKKEEPIEICTFSA